MEDDLNIFAKWKTTSINFLMEDALNFFENERRPNVFVYGRFKKNIEKIKEPEALKIKKMVVAPLRVT